MSDENAVIEGFGAVVARIDFVLHVVVAFGLQFLPIEFDSEEVVIGIVLG